MERIATITLNEEQIAEIEKLTDIEIMDESDAIYAINIILESFK